mmetsp:Transcript_12183/g.28901  ORF Transcript_12183/g.28901 Transcript_12183/m.28901 type:complete len:235 (+) Transcript_12183:544-1248(+)
MWTATNQPGENFSKFSRQAPQGMLSVEVNTPTASSFTGKLWGRNCRTGFNFATAPRTAQIGAGHLDPADIRPDSKGRSPRRGHLPPADELLLPVELERCPAEPVFEELLTFPELRLLPPRVPGLFLELRTPLLPPNGNQKPPKAILARRLSPKEPTALCALSFWSRPRWKRISRRVAGTEGDSAENSCFPSASRFSGCPEKRGRGNKPEGPWNRDRACESEISTFSTLSTLGKF